MQQQLYSQPEGERRNRKGFSTKLGAGLELPPQPHCAFQHSWARQPGEAINPITAAKASTKQVSKRSACGTTRCSLLSAARKRGPF